MRKYQVVVGNIGTVVDTDSRSEAVEAFDAYCADSDAPFGRAAGETVTMFKDGDPIVDNCPDPHAFGWAGDW